MLTVEKRLENLENAFNGIISMLNNMKFYSDADTQGVRQSVSMITPYTNTKTAYYGEKEKTFYDAPNGNISVFFSNYNGNYNVSRIADRVTISFDALSAETDITISIM